MKQLIFGGHAKGHANVDPDDSDDSLWLFQRCGPWMAMGWTLGMFGHLVNGHLVKDDSSFWALDALDALDALLSNENCNQGLNLSQMATQLHR